MARGTSDRPRPRLAAGELLQQYVLTVALLLLAYWSGEVDGIADRLVNAVSSFYFALLTDRVLCVLPAYDHGYQPGLEAAFTPGPNIDWTDVAYWNPTADDAWMDPGFPIYTQFVRSHLDRIGPYNATTLVLRMHRGISVALFNNPHHRRQMEGMGLRPDTAFGCAMAYLFGSLNAATRALAAAEPRLHGIMTDESAIKIGIQIRLGDAKILAQLQGDNQTAALDDEARKVVDGFLNCAATLAASVTGLSGPEGPQPETGHQAAGDRVAPGDVAGLQQLLAHGGTDQRLSDALSPVLLTAAAPPPLRPAAPPAGPPLRIYYYLMTDTLAVRQVALESRQWSSTSTSQTMACAALYWSTAAFGSLRPGPRLYSMEIADGTRMAGRGRVVAERASGFRSSDDADTLAAVAAASRQRVQRSAAFDHDDDVFGVDAAATRDRTASASTSGHDHPASGARRAVVAGASARRASSARTPRRAAAESLAAPEHDAEDDDEQELAHHAPADANAAALHMNGVAVGVDAAGAAALLLPAVEAAEEKKSHKRGLSRPPGLTEARDRETHDELRACDDWRDVLDVVADEAAVEGLSARTSVQALTKLNTLTRNSPGERAELIALPAFAALTKLVLDQGVANTMWALGRMGVYHPPAVEAALGAFRASAFAYKPQEVANLLLLGRLDELRPADLATALYALAYFNTAPGRAVLTRIAGRVLTLLEQRTRARAADAEDAEDASFLHPSSSSCAPELAPRLRKAGTRGPARHAMRWRPGTVLNGVELANLYWGFALLGSEQQLEPRLAERLMAGLEAALAEDLQRMVFQGFLASRLAGSSRRHAFSPLALDAFKRSWMASMTDTAARGTGGRSNKTPVKHVADIIHKLKVSYDTLRPTRDGLAVIDVALKAGPERYVALEVVAEADTAANSRQMLGPNAVKRQLLEKNGWEVRYLNAGDLLRLDADTQLLHPGGHERSACPARTRDKEGVAAAWRQLPVAAGNQLGETDVS
eukprot:XP_001699950.1 predicted protein [Chlamydomonas reinhardtii]